MKLGDSFDSKETLPGEMLKNGRRTPKRFGMLGWFQTFVHPETLVMIS